MSISEIQVIALLAVRIGSVRNLSGRRLFTRKLLTLMRQTNAMNGTEAIENKLARQPQCVVHGYCWRSLVKGSHIAHIGLCPH